MSTHAISTAKAFRFTGAFSFLLGILTVLLSALAYAPTHPGFSVFNTYLSDIGDTPIWPQIIFNSGTLLAAPLRFAILLLLVALLRTYTDNKATFEAAFLSIGALSTIGTVLMTAVPFSVSPAIHKSGIVLYFLGVVFLQLLLGVKESSIKSLPRVLPVLSFTTVATYIVFLALFILYEMGTVGRTTPVFWEWLCFFASMGWLAGHIMILGKEIINKSES